jgi:hypothetical protein
MPRPVRFTEFPDDLLADVQRRIAVEYHDGDFTQDPWFLAQGHEQFDAWAMPLSKRVTAMQGLTRVYTPEVCRRLLSKPIYAGIVSPLFSAPWPRGTSQKRPSVDVAKPANGLAETQWS